MRRKTRKNGKSEEEEMENVGVAQKRKDGKNESLEKEKWKAQYVR